MRFFLRRTWRGRCEDEGFGGGDSRSAPLPLEPSSFGGVRELRRSTVGAGVFATTGALASTLAPQPGPLRDQLRRLGSALALGGLGLVIGQ